MRISSLALILGCLAGCTTTTPLSESELLIKAQRIHKAAITLDTHKDIQDTLALQSFPEDPDARKAFRLRNDPTVRGDNQVDFPKMREGGYDVAFYIVYVGQSRNNPAAFRRAKSAALLKFKAIHRMADNYPEHIEIAYTAADVKRINDAGKLVACIGIENGYPMGTDLSLIEDFHKRGARYMGITHNGHNQLGDSHSEAEALHGGLTQLGRDAIAEMNRVGIMVDISHSAKSTMLQALAHSKAPVIASHSGARLLCDVTRNLDDEQLLAMKKNGGVVQAVALGAFVKATPKRRQAINDLRDELNLPRRGRQPSATNSSAGDDLETRLATFQNRMVELNKAFPPANVKDYVDHIDHMVEIMGIDHVAISSDFDGGGGVDGWNNAAETFNVTHEMVRRGYSEANINKIWSGNTLRCWHEVEAVAMRLQANR